MDIFELLTELNINCEVISHQAVSTVEEAKYPENMIKVIGCKNLILTDKKGWYFLFTIHEDKKANLKEMAK